MSLAAYRTRVQQLLANPTSPSINPLYATSDIDGWINQARGQVAGESECLRVIGTISTVASQRPYAFTSISIGTASSTGISGILNIRRITRTTSGAGQVLLTPRPWPWFDLYHMNTATVTNGAPTVWSQYAQGGGFVTQSISSVGGGSFYLDPPPDAIYTLNVDCVCYPLNLADDTTKEAIPPLWVDAVAYFSAYLALLSSQTSARINDALRMKQLYDDFIGRARTFANPSVLRYQYEQSSDPTLVAKLGLQQKAQGQ